MQNTCVKRLRGIAIERGKSGHLRGFCGVGSAKRKHPSLPRRPHSDVKSSFVTVLPEVNELRGLLSPVLVPRNC